MLQVLLYLVENLIKKNYLVCKCLIMGGQYKIFTNSHIDLL